MGIDVKKTLDGLLIEAKAERARYHYSEDECMGNTVVVIGPEGERGVLPLNWRDADEKRHKMYAVAKAAKETDAQAIILITDTRWVKGDIIGLHFGLPSIEEVGVHEFQKRYWAILSSKYDGQIKNLPRELWNEAVLVAIKGPQIEPEMRMACYIQGPDDEVMYVNGDSPPDAGVAQLYIIPDWWKL
jgi:hypothetical protein